MWQNADLLVVLVILDHGAPLRDMIDLSHYE